MINPSIKMRLERLERSRADYHKLYIVIYDDKNNEHWKYNGKEIPKPNIHPGDIILRDDI